MLKPKIMFVTGNPHKVEEVQQALPEFEIIGKKITLVEIQGPGEEIVRTKAKDAAQQCKGPVIVDDSAVYITAFNGFPGVYAADYHKIVGNTRTLTMLQGFQDRSAVMVSRAAYCEPRKEPVVFEGRVEGTIAREIRGTEGFGFDPIFIPEKEKKTFGEMSVEEKNKRNHRARSFTKLAAYLKERFKNYPLK